MNVKNQLIRLRTWGEEAFGATALPPNSAIFTTSACHPLLWACSTQ